MQVVEKTRHINANISGLGIEILAEMIKSSFPTVQIINEKDDDDEYIDWDSSEIAKEIRAERTPGLTLQAYRSREGLSLVELAKKVGTKYTNISAMEHDRRAIGVHMAKRLGAVLHVDFAKFLN